MVRLPSLQFSVIIGLILSDAWLIFASINHKNVRLGFKQSIAHSGYFWFVFNILSHYCSSFPHPIKGLRNGNQYFAIVFFTRSLPCLNELHSLFYVNKVKVIPQNIFELLTPVALAHWIMGDGTVRSSGLILCTDSYTVPDVVRLVNVLIIRYNLDCILQKHKQNYRIYIRQASMALLRTIVTPICTLLWNTK